MTGWAAAGLVAVAACVSVAGCGSGAAKPVAARPAPPASASASPTGKPPVDGPSAPATAQPATAQPAAAASGAASAPCQDALTAEQVLEASQGKDKGNPGALDQDFTTFANRLAADAQKEANPSAAQAMTNLSNDYTDLVESQTGTAQLPDMTTLQNDGTAFDQACGG
jgi:hypothetical protein